MCPEDEWWAELDIKDAERSQGLEEEFTSLPVDVTDAMGFKTSLSVLAKRHTCVGNALYGRVR